MAFSNTEELFFFLLFKQKVEKERINKQDGILKEPRKYESKIKLYFRNIIKNKNENGVLVKK